jgi:hypothetical protein
MPVLEKINDQLAVALYLIFNNAATMNESPETRILQKIIDSKIGHIL